MQFLPGERYERLVGGMNVVGYQVTFLWGQCSEACCMLPVELKSGGSYDAAGAINKAQSVV